MDLAYIGIWWGGWWFALVVYFIPTIIALFRASALNWVGIFLLNLFFGWTVIGWILALIWALTTNSPHYYYRRWRGGW